MIVGLVKERLGEPKERLIGPTMPHSLSGPPSALGWPATAAHRPARAAPRSGRPGRPVVLGRRRTGCRLERGQPLEGPSR